MKAPAPPTFHQVGRGFLNNDDDHVHDDDEDAEDNEDDEDSLLPPGVQRVPCRRAEHCPPLFLLLSIW